MAMSHVVPHVRLSWQYQELVRMPCIAAHLGGGKSGGGESGGGESGGGKLQTRYISSYLRSSLENLLCMRHAKLLTLVVGGLGAANLAVVKAEGESCMHERSA